MPEPYRLPTSLVHLVEKLYDPSLPYHNFNHALDVIRRATEILDRCAAEQVAVNREVVLVAALFHDAGYRADHRQLGYPSKEEYAAHLMRDTLRGLAYPGLFIADVAAAIAATDIEARQRTNEDRALRAADVGNLADEYEIFTDANRRLKLEAEQLGGQAISWLQWKARTRDIANLFVQQDIHLTSAHDTPDGRSVWHERTQANLNRFFNDPEFQH